MVQHKMYSNIVFFFMGMCCFSNGYANVFNTKDLTKYNSCDDVLRSGSYNNSGSYKVYLNSSEPLEVYCRFDGDIAYTSIMQQKYGHVSFERPMADYVRGFGQQALGDFWLGLYNIKRLSDAQYRVLTITMQDWQNVVKTIQYRWFYLGPGYRLSISNYVSGGILPDDLSHNSGAVFATYDRPDVHNCANQMKAGWWYNYCTYTLPTGHYYIGGPYTPSGKMYDGIFYADWFGFGYSLKYIKLELSQN